MISISESWLDIENKDFFAKYAVPDYTLFNSDRTSKALLLLEHNLNPVVKNVVAVNNIDSILFRTKLGLVGLIYKPLT